MFMFLFFFGINNPAQVLKTFHHFQSFKDWEGRDRVVVNLGFGSDGGPHFILDPDDDNRVARAILKGRAMDGMRARSVGPG